MNENSSSPLKHSRLILNGVRERSEKREIVMPVELAELSRKTRLVVRSLHSAAVNRPFDELEEDDAQEQADTFDY